MVARSGRNLWAPDSQTPHVCDQISSPFLGSGFGASLQRDRVMEKWGLLLVGRKYTHPQSGTPMTVEVTSACRSPCRCRIRSSEDQDQRRMLALRANVGAWRWTWDARGVIHGRCVDGVCRVGKEASPGELSKLDMVRRATRRSVPSVQ